MGGPPKLRRQMSNNDPANWLTHPYGNRQGGTSGYPNHQVFYDPAILAQYRPAEKFGPLKPAGLCAVCHGTGEVPYGNFSDSPSENKRPCAACKVKPI